MKLEDLLQTALGGGIIGSSAVVAISFLRKILSRNSLEVTQIESLRTSIEIMQTMMEREAVAREEAEERRVREREEWRRYEDLLKAEVQRLTEELHSTRIQLDKLQAALRRVAPNDPVFGLP